MLPHTKSFKSGQLSPTDPLLPKKIAPAQKIFQIGSVIPRLTRFCHDWPSCSKAGQIGATTRQCALKKKCDFFLMPIAFSCSKTSTYSKKLRCIPQTLRWSRPRFPFPDTFFASPHDGNRCRVGNKSTKARGARRMTLFLGPQDSDGARTSTPPKPYSPRH